MSKDAGEYTWSGIGAGDSVTWTGTDNVNLCGRPVVLYRKRGWLERLFTLPWRPLLGHTQIANGYLDGVTLGTEPGEVVFTVSKDPPCPEWLQRDKDDWLFQGAK